MTRKIKILIGITLIIMVLTVILTITFSEKGTLRSVRSEKELMRLANNNSYSDRKEWIAFILGMPFSFLDVIDSFTPVRNSAIYDDYSFRSDNSSSGFNPSEFSSDSEVNESSLKGNNSKNTKDYSKTNIQVENVDEADITKTDGDYIYSISETDVIITNVKDPSNIKIDAKITSTIEEIPEDLMLYNNKLAVIYTNYNSRGYTYNNNSNTIVRIYDIDDRTRPREMKNFELHETYYTSRCINNELYIISSGKLREENKKIDRKYNEDREEKEIPLKNIKYLKNVETKNQTLIAAVDLNDLEKEIDLSSFLVDVSNAYVSENNIYLLDQGYNYDDEYKITDIFGLKGVFGIFDDDDFRSTIETEIYKFEISNNGKVSYSTHTKIEGQTINQYSLDEKDGHLRIALYDTREGTRVAIFNDNLKQIGITGYVAKGEKMYSSRFMGDKVYLVTFKTMDPLFVIDLSDESKPRVLGELKIPGYSTYLHPYDEDHIIGIGMQTEETVNKNMYGRITSTTSRITGMKMALFDVSDVRSPRQISETVIGDNRTTSAILTNPKALLFSKEKQLIAIPVNNYDEDFKLNSSTSSYSEMINSYKNYNKTRVGEGYFVYNINLEEGFKLKGVITHKTAEKNNNNKYYYSYMTSKLLRGLYIDNNLYTVSETAIKVNNLDDLNLVCELKIKE